MQIFHYVPIPNVPIPKPLISHRLSLAELSRGFEILLDPKGQADKVVIQIPETGVL